MGICYSQQQQWQSYRLSRRNQGRRKRRQERNSVIYQEKTVYDSSFASEVYASFREDLHRTISQIAQQDGSLFMGSIVEMKQEELEILYKSLHKINPSGEAHVLSEPIIFCNIKTKNYLHTHKIKVPQCKTLNQISCCPFNSNHIAEYDIWMLIKTDKVEPQLPLLQNQNNDESINVYIYHPFTKRFLNFQKGSVVGSQERKSWQVYSYGQRRNGGFVKISCAQGELCMSEQKGLLDKHRKLSVCKQKHISHLWQIMFVEPEFV